MTGAPAPSPERHELLVASLPLRPGDTVLDVGCGTGLCAPLLRRPPRPVRQNEGIAVQDQVHQRGTVGRGHRPQVAGKSGHIGEHVYRPEPAGEFPRPDYALDGPARLVDQDPAPGPGGATRPPVPLDRAGAITVGPHLAHLDPGERGAPALWMTGHPPMFGPPAGGGRQSRQQTSPAE